MQLNAERLVKRVRRHLLDTAGQQQGNTWQDGSILEALNEEQDCLAEKIVETTEDWFMVVKDVDVVSGDPTIDLYDGFLKLRYLELGGDTSSNPTFINAIESRLVEGVNGPSTQVAPTSSPHWYALVGDELHIQPAPLVTQAKYGRAWFIRMPGPIILETIVSSAAADKTIFASSGETPPENDIMEGILCDVVSGTGAGQRRRIIAWNGLTREATFNSGFAPALDATSKIATVSRVPGLYHKLLHLGAALRLMVDVKEDARGIQVLYDDSMESFIGFIEKRTGGQRGIVPWDADDAD